MLEPNSNVAITTTDYQNAKIAAQRLALVNSIEEVVGWALTLVKAGGVDDIAGALAILAKQKPGTWHPIIEQPDGSRFMMVFPGNPPEDECDDSENHDPNDRCSSSDTEKPRKLGLQK